MTDEQIKGIARAINPHWWNDDIDLLNFTRVVLSRERAHDEALLRQALADLEGAANYIDKLGGVSQKYRQTIAALKPRLGETK